MLIEKRPDEYMHLILIIRGKLMQINFATLMTQNRSLLSQEVNAGGKTVAMRDLM